MDTNRAHGDPQKIRSISAANAAYEAAKRVKAPDEEA
jgi:hypothetical protein